MFGLEGSLNWWRAEADQLRAQILDRGVVDGRFRRANDDDNLDASLLLLPIVGFVDGTDAVAVATLGRGPRATQAGRRRIGIPAATTGLVYPVWAMVAMALSVTTIFVNSIGARPSLLFQAIASVGRKPADEPDAAAPAARP